MKFDTKDLLFSLLSHASPSGHESGLLDAVHTLLAPCADTISRDVNGNLAATINLGAPRRVMLSAHADEVGLMVMNIDNRGFLSIATIGGVDPVILPGRPVTIHSARGPVHGVIGRKPFHHIEPDDRGKPLRINDLWVDIGASSTEDAKSAVAVGDYLSLRVEAAPLRNGLVTGRGLDNRAGVATLVKTVLALKGKRIGVTLVAVASVQEELGSRGARTAAFAAEPDATIAIDVGHASDYPGGEARRFGDCHLGAGPILYRGPNIHPQLGAMLEQTARKIRMPVQVLAEPRPTPTEADPLQISRGGTAAAVVKVPIRHMHTPVEVIALSDIDSLAKLLSRFLLDLKPDSACFPPKQ
jgi:putative aminopeptidase FrvX